VADCSDERLQFAGATSDDIGELAQDPRDLLALGDLGLAEAVRVVDGRKRLDEERLPGARRIVHDPRNAPSRRCPQRQHGAPSALGDEVVLQVLGERGIAGDLAEALGELAAPFPEHAPQATEVGRGRVTQVGPVLLDRPPDLLGDREQ